MIWRLPAEGFATLQEVETHYSLSDCVLAHAVLDSRAWADYYARKAGAPK